MSVSAVTTLGTPFHSNASGQSTIPYGSVTFPTNGQDVLGIMRIAVSGTPTSETISVVDSAGNVWTVVSKAETGNTNGAHTAIAYFAYPSAGSNTTVTITVTLGTAVNERDAVVGWATGHDTASPLDTSGTFAGIGSTTSASVSTSGSAAAGGLAVTAFAVGNASGTGPTGYPGTGWTGDGNTGDATRGRTTAFTSKQVTGAGVVTAGAYTFTASSLTPPAFSIAVFKAPGTPVNTVAPAVTGTATIGSTLSTTDGTWTNTPTSFAYQWQRDVGTSGVTWVDIAGATANTYVVTKNDMGCKVRCRVSATNATGTSAPAASNATGVVPTPAGDLTWRIVAGPIAQTDGQHRSTTLALPVLPGDLMVVFVACSNADTIDGNGNKSDVGIVEDTGAHTWTQRVEAFANTGADTGIQHAAQAFSAQSSAGLAYGSTITLTVHGMVASDPGTPDFANNPVGYHGFSPYWFVVAISTGDSRVLTFDQGAHNVNILTSHVAPSITTTNLAAIVFGFHAAPGAAAGWWTPVGGFTEVCDTDSGTESGYSISAETQVVTAGYTGGAGGSTASNKTVTNLVAAFSTPGTTKSITETGAGTDGVLLTTSILGTDTGAGADSSALNAALPATETAVGADVSSLATNTPVADAAIGLDTFSVVTGGTSSVSFSDSSSGADGVGLAQAALVLVEAGAVQDSYEPIATGLAWAQTAVGQDGFFLRQEQFHVADGYIGYVHDSALSGKVIKVTDTEG